MKRAMFTGGEVEKSRFADETRVRTNFRCAAHGCPNSAAIDDHSEQQPGKCFHHWSASRSEWDRITNEIRRDDSMRNHGMVPVKPSKFTLDARAASRGGKLGMRAITTGDEVAI